MLSRSIPKVIDVPFLNAPVGKLSVIDDRDSEPGGASTVIWLALILMSLPRVNGKPVSRVVSNFKNPFVRSIVIDFSDSFFLLLEKLRVKKFRSRADALLLLPMPLKVTVPPTKRFLRRGWVCGGGNPRGKKWYRARFL